MTSIDTPHRTGATVRVHRGGASLAGRAAALWAAAVARLDIRGAPSRLLRLDDRLLRDIGETRADLEIDAIYWPFRAPRSRRPD